MCVCELAERPVVLSAATLLCTGLCLVLYSRAKKTEDAVSATEYLRQIAHSRTRAELLRLLAVPVALVARAFLFRHTLWWTQCTVQGAFVSFTHTHREREYMLRPEFR